MPDLERSAVTPTAARSGLLWLMIILSAWSGTSSAGMTKATTAIAVTESSATAAATRVSEVALPEQLPHREWLSIRAAYEASRHAVQHSVQRDSG